MTGIVQGIDGRFGGLLGHEDLSEVGLAKLADPPSHLVELAGQHTELVARTNLDNRVEMARRHTRGRRSQLAHGPDDAL